MKNVIKMAVAIVALQGSTFVFASDACDQYTTSYDRTYCSSKMFIESDKDLNAVYKELKNLVKSDTKNGLTQVQRQWMAYRDEVCQPEYGTINVDCNYRLNRQRVIYLKDRLTECKVGSCQHNKIISPSWDD